MPHFKVELSEQGLIENLRLASLEEYLQRTRKIGLLYNADDIILEADELDYFIKVVGSPSNLSPRGPLRQSGPPGHAAYHRGFLSKPPPRKHGPETCEDFSDAHTDCCWLPDATGNRAERSFCPSYSTKDFVHTLWRLPILTRKKFQKWEGRTQKSHAYLQAAQDRATASENIS